MAIRIEIKATPQSGRQGFTRDKSGILKCFLKSPPEDGKANDELVMLLSKQLGIRQDQIKIIQGATSRKKVLKIDTELSEQAFLHKLGIEVQTSF
jgi:uncharacterized protein